VVDGGDLEPYSGAKWRVVEGSAARRVDGRGEREGADVADGARFFGSYEHSLDAKGRVILPARLRVHFTQPGFLTPHLEGCLALWRSEDFDREVEIQLAAAESDPSTRNRVRDWASNVFEADVDKQGRMAVPPNLRGYASLDLEQPILIVGMINRVEFWSPATWASRTLDASVAGS
jgi:MraZ protein